MKSVKKYFILLTLISLVAMAIMPAISANASQTYFIYRNQAIQYTLDPGDTITVYYCPDGRTATLEMSSNAFNWWMEDPFTTITIYTSPDNYCGANARWYELRTFLFDPHTQRFGLALGQGLYKFVIRNRNGVSDLPRLRIY